MTCGILLVTHTGVGTSLLEVTTALLRQLPLKTEAFEVPFDADLDALLPAASAAMRRVEGEGGVLILTDLYGASPSNLAGKLARREGEVRMGRGAGVWLDSATTFGAIQARYELRAQWHALGEYRQLQVKDGGTRQGFLVGVDRDLSGNFRIGAGYNFTEFSDDLTDFDYDHKGWFVNLSGRY